MTKTTIPCELVSWPRVVELSRDLVRQIRAADVTVEMIVAIGRGGYMPARLLSDLLGVFNLTSFKIEHYRGVHKDSLATVKYPLNAPVDERSLLLVDDVSDSGDTFKVALQHLLSLGKPARIYTAALHHKTVSGFVPDFYAEKIEQWRWLIYPWAVSEDLVSFISAMEPHNRSIENTKAFLKRQHGIDASPEQIQDALLLLDNSKE